MREGMADKPDEKDEPQDVSAYLGVDPIYMNHSDDRNKPFRAEEVDEDPEGAVQSNEEVVSTEDVAYSHQEWTREDAGQDPVTGVPLDISEKDAFDAKREQYKDPAWGPNVPHAMTGKDEGSSEAPVSNETDEEFAARVAKANEQNNQATGTGSTDEVKADGTTGSTPSAPSAPAAAKKTAAADKK